MPAPGDGGSNGAGGSGNSSSGGGGGGNGVGSSFGGRNDFGIDKSKSSSPTGRSGRDDRGSKRLRPIETKKAKRIKKTRNPKKLLKDKDSFADDPPVAPLTDVAFADRRSRGRTGSSVLAGRGLGDSSGNIFRPTLGG